MMSQKNMPCWRSQCIYVMHDDNLGTDRLNLIDLKNIRWTVDDDKDDKEDTINNVLIPNGSVS